MKKLTRETVQISALALILSLLPSVGIRAEDTKEPVSASPEFTIASYYFPSYHPDPRREARRGKGWTEWELVRNAKPRFEGHAQPKLPLWGYEDESDPKVMAKKIDMAADHGIDAFIFDWYWYDGPFLERGLERGFFGAENNRRLKFALMWANHDWLDIFPRTLKHDPAIIYPGSVTPATFEAVTDYVIKKYFSHPSAWKIDGKPYFSFYDLGTLIKSFGSLAATREELDRFRKKTEAAGFPGLHLNAVVWGQTVLPNETIPANPTDLVDALGFDSVTSYVWLHHVGLDEFPETPYLKVMDKYFEYCEDASQKFHVPYFPNVTMGWDSSPRTEQSGPFLNKGYPFTPVMRGNTPDAFRNALAAAREFLALRPADQRVLTLNCWNEWTEGSYLEPDTVTGFQYLEAVKQVFGDSRGE